MVVTTEVRQKLADQFRTMAEAWVLCQRLPFVPTYSPDPGEIHHIADFELPDWITSAATHPQQLPAVDFAPVREGKMAAKAILAIDKTIGGGTTCYFQLMDKRNVLGQFGRFTLLYDQNTFRSLDDIAVTVGDKLSAIASDTDGLVFLSYSVAAQLLDLHDHFRAATDEDIKAILGHARVHCPGEQVNGILGHCDDTARKRFALAQLDGVFDALSADEIVGRAAKFGIALQKTGPAQNRKVVFPTDKEVIRLFLAFLTNGYYHSVIDDRRFRSTSHRPL